jgi:ubiquinone/menaquinone biosynthesis C-methylase UbiE
MADKQMIVEAFTELAPRYEDVVDAELKRFWGWSYDGFIDNLIDLTVFNPDDVVLDVATGTGVIPLKLVARGTKTAQIVGLDITPAMLRKAALKKKTTAPAAHIDLTCASAMGMPYRAGVFNVIVCGLATHHLDVPLVLSEMHRVLKPGGRLTIADVGGSAAWRQPPVKHLIKAATFLYFLPKHGYARARSEASALNHVYTGKEWKEELEVIGFNKITIIELPANHAWSPTPLVIRAVKNFGVTS